MHRLHSGELRAFYCQCSRWNTLKLYILIFTRIRRMGEGNIFSLFNTGVPQYQVLSKISGPRSFLGVPQSCLGEGVPQYQVLSKISGPRSFLGVPQSCLGREYPSIRFFPRSLVPGPFWGGRVPQSWPGGTPWQARRVRQDRGTP